MKKALLSLVSLFVLTFHTNAQLLKLECFGESLPAAYAARITKTLTKEVEFYSPLGLRDTVTVKLRVFKEMDSANAFIRQYVPTAYGRYCSGMFLPSIETAVIATTEEMDSAVRVLFHEISHFLFHKALNDTPAQAARTTYGLNEGIACYFEFIMVKKDGSIVHKNDRMYLSDVKSLIEIDEFNIDEYLTIDSSVFEDKSRHDGAISYHASYAIVLTLFDKLGPDRMRQLLRMIQQGSTYASAVESLYPGGKEALDNDIRKMVLKRG